MFRKVILAGLVLFVVLPGVWLGVEHLRGRARLAAVLAEQTARGEVFDINLLAGPVGPAASNGLPAQIAAAQRMSDASTLLSPACRMVAPGRGVPPTRVDWWPERNGSNTWSDVGAWVERHGADLDALHASLDAPMRRAELDYSQGFSKLLLPHLSPIKITVTALSLSAMESAHRGDLDGALLDLEAIRVVQADLASEPILISQLVRVACASIANSRFWSVFHAGDWSEDQLARMQAALPAKDLMPAMVRGLEGERAMCLAELRRGSSKELAEIWGDNDSMFAAMGGGGPAPLDVPESVDEAVELAGTVLQRTAEGLRTQVLFPLWRFAWGEQAVAYYLEAMDTMLRANRAAMGAQSAEEVERLDLLPVLRPQGFYIRLRSRYAGVLMPALARASLKAFRAETEIALSEAGIALRRFQLRNGRLPENLEELVPAFLPAVPVDRMDGKPLRYRRDGEREFTLWSVGENMKDDGGDANWPPDRTSMTQWWNARDAVWPQPAGAEETAAWLNKAAKEPKGAAFNMSADVMRRYGLLPATNAPAGGER